MSWAHYLLQVNIYLVIFYCFYKLLLDKETYFVLNRIYLIAAGLLSLAIPFLRFEWFNKQKVTQQIHVGVDELNNLVTKVAVIEDDATKLNWGSLIVSIYLLGMVFCLIRLIFQLVSVRKMLKTIGNGAAFSFLNKKVVSANLPEIATVSSHEDVHIKQLHTIDVLFFEILGIITWFNPIIYAYKKTIKNIHEFLADEVAAHFQGDKEAYAMLLLSQAFGVKSNSLTNGFTSRSLIKKRIYMLHKQRSKKVAFLKYGLFVPLFALTLALSSATIRQNNQILAVAETIPLNDAKALVDQIIETPLRVVQLVAPPPPVEQTKQETLILNNPIANQSNTESAVMLRAFYNHLAASLRYPEEARKGRLNGEMVVALSVHDGKITDINTRNDLGNGFQESVVKSISSYTEPMKDGRYNFKVVFRLIDDETTDQYQEYSSSTQDELQIIMVTTYADKTPKLEKSLADALNILPDVSISNSEKAVYSFIAVENPPKYPGGIEGFYDFIGKTIKYPALAADNEIEGTALVSFVIEKDGSLSNTKIENKVGYGIDEEALRVIKLSKRWNPGIQNGRAVRVAYKVPIKFTLNQVKSENKTAVVAGIRLKNFPDGKNAPLFIVDGELKEAIIAKDLDVKKIEKIDVLKSENAMALFGKKAENGVILITSKKPERPVVSATIFK